MKLPPFYTARYVEINSAGLSLLWLASGLAIVLLTVSSAPSRFLIVPFFSPRNHLFLSATRAGPSLN